MTLPTINNPRKCRDCGKPILYDPRTIYDIWRQRVLCDSCQPTPDPIRRRNAPELKTPKPKSTMTDAELDAAQQRLNIEIDRRLFEKSGYECQPARIFTPEEIEAVRHLYEQPKRTNSKERTYNFSPRDTFAFSGHF